MRTLLVVLLLAVTVSSSAQHLKLKNYSAGYRAFEVDGVGNNPLTILPFLKKPATYQNFINSLQYNGLYGNPSIQILRNYYFGAEWYKDSTESRFWKKYSLQTNLYLSNRLKKDNMALLNEQVVFSPNDTTFHRDQYSLVQQQQFVGATIGINRRFKISNRLKFFTGFHVQGSYAYLHKYQQRLDSSVFNHQSRTTKITLLPDLEGRKFFQWQAMIPIGVEMNVWKESIFIRAEAIAGIIGDRYRTTWPKREAHGLGFALIYRPENNNVNKRK